MAGAAERAFPAAQVAAYGGGRVIASPFQFATTDDDNLQIVSANSLAGVVLAVQGRRLTSAGAIEPFSFTHIPNADRTSRTENYKLGAGALLNLTIFASAGSPMIGQTYVSARLIHGLSAATIMLGALLGGYVTAAQPLAYPGSPIQSSIEGGGVTRTIIGTDPAAGVEMAETVPSGARWEFISLRVGFSTSAAAGNRQPSLQFRHSGLAFYQAPHFTTVPAGSGPALGWGVNMTFTTAASVSILIAGIPAGLVIEAGDTIAGVTANLDAGDNYGAPIYKVREWLEVSS